MCNTATIFKNKETDSWEANGDATEVALTVVCAAVFNVCEYLTDAILPQFVHKLGFGRPHLTKAEPLNRKQTAESQGMERVNSTASEHGKPRGAPLTGYYELLVEHPFDSTLKRMSTVYRFHPHEGSEDKPHLLILMKGAVVGVCSLQSFVLNDLKCRLFYRNA